MKGLFHFENFGSLGFLWRIAAVALLLEVVIISFARAIPFFGESTSLLFLFPILLAGFLLGGAWAFLVSLFILPINLLLLRHYSVDFNLAAAFLCSFGIGVVGLLMGFLNASLVTAQAAIKKSKQLGLNLETAKDNVETEVRVRSLELEQERNRLESSMNALQIGFVITDLDYKIVNINSAAKHLLCLTERGSVHRPGVLLDPLAINSSCEMEDIEEQLKGVFDLRKNLQVCLEKRQPISVGNLDFRDLVLHILISPIVVFKSGLIDVIGAVILVEDITAEKLLDRARDEFFSIASHELRTPLTSIRGNTAMIAQFYEKILKKDKNLAEMISDIHASSVRLIEIVNDFLDTSRIEQGRLVYSKEEFELKKLSEEMVKEVDGLVKERKLYVKLEIPDGLPSVFADRNRIKQVLINLVGNSLKFTDKGGVTVKSAREGNFIKTWVTDTGKGIEKQNQKLLFRKFQQAGSSILTRDAIRGTGLGLYISKQMIEAMGGAIRLESSDPGKGSIFSFTLPVAGTAAANKKGEKKELPAAAV